MIYVAIMGFGVVGSGVYEVMQKNSSHIAVKSMEHLEIKYILDTKEIEYPGISDKIIDDFEIILNDPEVRIVVEAIGGVGAAYEFTKRLLSAGKHVVTSNKELVATHGYELLTIASSKNVNYMFEASVGGGIPIIRPMIQCLSANEIENIYGIMNGTTNYVLTKMFEDGLSFEKALSDAQELGFAESDPADDVEGYDAARKMCILSSLAFGRHVNPAQVNCEGILKITPEDVKYAEQVGMSIKLLGRYVRISEKRICVFVAPHLVDNSIPIATVGNVFNGIVVHGNAVGEVMFYGRGAGKLPTASAVVADVIDAARHVDKTKNAFLWGEEGDFVEDYRILEESYFVRAGCSPDVIVKIFGDVQFVYSEDSSKDSDECAFLTSKMSGFEFEEKIADLLKETEVFSTIRVLP
jgi:homoserine dehydrogenase